MISLQVSWTISILLFMALASLGGVDRAENLRAVANEELYIISQRAKEALALSSWMESMATICVRAIIMSA